MGIEVVKAKAYLINEILQEISQILSESIELKEDIWLLKDDFGPVLESLNSMDANSLSKFMPFTERFIKHVSLRNAEHDNIVEIIGKISARAEDIIDEYKKKLEG